AARGGTRSRRLGLRSDRGILERSPHCLIPGPEARVVGVVARNPAEAPLCSGTLALGLSQAVERLDGERVADRRVRLAKHGQEHLVREARSSLRSRRAPDARRRAPSQRLEPGRDERLVPDRVALLDRRVPRQGDGRSALERLAHDLLAKRRVLADARASPESGSDLPERLLDPLLGHAVARKPLQRRSLGLGAVVAADQSGRDERLVVAAEKAIEGRLRLGPSAGAALHVRATCPAVVLGKRRNVAEILCALEKSLAHLL